MDSTNKPNTDNVHALIAWRSWLEELSHAGYSEYASVGEDEQLRALVVQLYTHNWTQGDQPLRSTFSPIPVFLVAIAGTERDTLGDEADLLNRMLVDSTIAQLVQGQAELHEFLRLGPQAWQALQGGSFLTVLQAAERLRVQAATIYEYCRNFHTNRRAVPYDRMPAEGQEYEESPRRKRTSTRWLFHYQWSQGDIQIPLWAIELFRMLYEGKEEHLLRSTRNDIRLIFGDREPYKGWQGAKGAERILWLPRFEFQRTGGEKRSHWVRALVGIAEIPHVATSREFGKEYLDEHPCPPEEVWLIEDVIKYGGPVTYDVSPDEYWTLRSRMEYERLLYQQEELGED